MTTAVAGHTPHPGPGLFNEATNMYVVAPPIGSLGVATHLSQ